MRGGGLAVAGDRADLEGRSPHARGRPTAGAAKGRASRSIPACAGEAASTSMPCSMMRVDPRMRGGGAAADHLADQLAGRSPHARGRHRLRLGRRFQDGSIPACAGEAGPRRSRPRAHRVDPRMRGGGSSPAPAPRARRGRSPHARGRRFRVARGARELGSIPACAGEARIRRRRRGRERVDPRMRGGGSTDTRQGGDSAGRSPHARGRRGRGRDRNACPRSIPACAGEAWRVRSGLRCSRVDPRMRGGGEG